VEHFSVIQSLCRLGLKSGDKAFRQQVERLRDRMAKSGDKASAETLQRLLGNATQTVEMVPSRVELSRFQISGEHLTELVHPPVDRETSQPLCKIVLNPGSRSMRPFLSERSQTAIANLINEWRLHDRLEALGVAPGRSCLIFGPPGTGKTLSAYYLATELGLPVVDARIDGLISSFLGTTARNIANLFAFANRYRCLLLLDEFDAVAKLRDDPQEVGEIKRVVNSLLQNLDDRANVGVTVAVTNHHRLLDTAVWRRFENQIQLDPPDLRTRMDMLSLFLKPLPQNQALLRSMAYVTDNRSGADLRRMANAIKRRIALAGIDPTPAAQFDAFRQVLSGEPPSRISLRATLLAEDVGRFVAHAMTDPEFEVKQKPLGALLAVNQATISRWVSKLDGHPIEAGHA
jgi:hypothetical protein